MKHRYDFLVKDIIIVASYFTDVFDLWSCTNGTILLEVLNFKVFVGNVI